MKAAVGFMQKPRTLRIAVAIARQHPRHKGDIKQQISQARVNFGPEKSDLGTNFDAEGVQNEQKVKILK